MTAPPPIRRGHVFIADLDPRRGTEPGKVRPVVVVQTDALNPHHTSTLVCPVTSRVGGAASLLRVRLKRGQGGVKKDSEVLVDQIRALDNRRLLAHLGALPRDRMDELHAKLVAIMDLG